MSDSFVYPLSVVPKGFSYKRGSICCCYKCSLVFNAVKGIFDPDNPSTETNPTDVNNEGKFDMEKYKTKYISFDPFDSRANNRGYHVYDS